VPFRGGAEALAALMGGHIPMAIGTLASGLAIAREGRVKLLALVDAERAEAVPEVPRLSEYLPGAMVPTIRFGLFGPAGLPSPVTARLNQLAEAAVATPEYRARLASAGMQPQHGTPEEARRRFAADIEDFRRIIAATGLQPG
jgi:tripartite-type tricarboxylate transporter receptor subunit TctC